MIIVLIVIFVVNYALLTVTHYTYVVRPSAKRRVNNSFTIYKLIITGSDCINNGKIKRNKGGMLIADILS